MSVAITVVDVDFDILLVFVPVVSVDMLLVDVGNVADVTACDDVGSVVYEMTQFNTPLQSHVVFV